MPAVPALTHLGAVPAVHVEAQHRRYDHRAVALIAAVHVTHKDVHLGL